MEKGIGGGPQPEGHDVAVEASAELWRYPVNTSGIVDHPTGREEEIGGAHIAETTDSKGIS